MVDEGYAATQILSQLHESIIEKDLGDKQKSAITEKMAVSNEWISELSWQRNAEKSRCCSVSLLQEALSHRCVTSTCF